MACLPELLTPDAGGFHDDGIYLVTAKALAEGNGYVIASLPDALPQTKYPVLFPAVLAALWTLFPSFPANLPLLRLVPWLAMWVWLWLTWKLIGEELQRREAALWIISLTLATPVVPFLGTRIMAETMFAALASWAVLLMVRWSRPAATAGIRAAVLLGVVCALAFHTRTIGITLLPAATAVFWRRRDLGACLALGLTWLLLCGPWFLWQAMHVEPSDPILAYYTHANYSAWNLVTGYDASLLADVVLTNVILILAAPAQLWGALWLLRVPVILLCVGIAGIIGSIRLLRRADTIPLGIWLGSTLAVLLLWTWPPYRFLVPMLPVAALSLIVVFDGFRARWTAAGGRLVAAVALVLALWHSIQVLSESGAAETTWQRATADARAELSAARDWIAANTPDSSIIAANLDPTYWLYSGRKAFRTFAADPFELFYRDGAVLGSLGTEERLRHTLLRHRADYLVYEDLRIFSETEPLRRQIEAFRMRWPAVLQVAWVSERGLVTVYEIAW